MTSMHNSFYSKNTIVRPPPLTAQSPCRSSHRRINSPRSNPTKTRRLWNITSHNTPKPSNRLYGISLHYIISMRNNYNQLNLPPSNRPKISHCILFRQSYSTRHRSHPHSNTLKLYRSHSSNNRPWPYILYTFLPSKL